MRGGKRGGAGRAEGLQTEMEDCGGACWRETGISKRDTWEREGTNV